MAMFKDVLLLPDPYFLMPTSTQGPISYTMPSVNNAHAARFIATTTNDIASIVVSFVSVATAGTIECRIETIDATTGKPTGSLYDANATKSFTPTANTNTITFNTLPTTGLTVGTAYAIVLITTSSGTTHTLRSRTHPSFDFSAYPVAGLTATDGSTRSNFSEVGAIPVAGFIMEDGSYDVMGMCPYTAVTSHSLFGSDRAAATKITLDRPIYIKGVKGGGLLTRNGTPAGDLRVRILDSTNTAVTNCTWNIDKDYLVNSSARGITLPTPGNILLNAGVYRITMDNTGSANGTANFDMRAAQTLVSNFVNTDFAFSTTTNMSSSFTWTDTTGTIPPLGLVMASDTTEKSYLFMG